MPAKRPTSRKSSTSNADVAPIVERLGRMVLNQLTLIERVQNELISLESALDAAQYATALTRLQTGLSAMVTPWLKASVMAEPESDSESGALIEVIRAAQADDETEQERLRDEERQRIANEAVEGGSKASSETVG